MRVRGEREREKEGEKVRVRGERKGEKEKYTVFYLLTIYFLRIISFCLFRCK